MDFEFKEISGETLKKSSGKELFSGFGSLIRTVRNSDCRVWARSEVECLGKCGDVFIYFFIIIIIIVL